MSPARRLSLAAAFAAFPLIVPPADAAPPTAGDLGRSGFDRSGAVRSSLDLSAYDRSSLGSRSGAVPGPSFPAAGGAASVLAPAFAAGPEYPASPNRYVPGYGYAPPTGLSAHGTGPTWAGPSWTGATYSDGYAFGQKRFGYPFDLHRGAGFRADGYGGPFFLPGSSTNYRGFGPWPPVSPGSAFHGPTGPPFTGTGIGGWPSGPGTERPLGTAF
ncbi:hypothetical protein [Alienimonas chondri]|uniref:hypothetical protein n=1 Tax=Alienimonas chondri TaxID=2681879 RepID=UPI0014877B44|nr:hypothetical protein [Alienimonas chondri]